MSAKETGSRLPRRLSLILLLVVLLGIPAVVSTSLISREIQGGVTSGAQPGGLVQGEVADESGTPLSGHAVVLVLVSPDRARDPRASAVTGADGRFELVAPPGHGHYQLRAGGGEWQRVVREVSFLDRRGEPIQPEPLSITLQPGALLELDFVLADGRPASDGRFVLEGSYGKGLLFGLVPFSLRHEGSIAGGRVRLDGIPPMKAHLSAVFETGETLELELALEPGRNSRRIEL